MLRFVKGLVLAGTLGVGMLALGGPARADILPLPTDPTVTDLMNGTFQYDYHPFVTSAQEVQTGDFFTIYDFPGLISATAAPNWNVSIQPLGVTDPDVTPADSPALLNATFTYAGMTTIAGEAPLGTFSLVSPFTNPVGGFRNWLGRGTLAGMNMKNVNLTSIKVPTTPPPGVVPEPGTMALLGLGAAPLLGKLRRRFRKA